MQRHKDFLMRKILLLATLVIPGYLSAESLNVSMNCPEWVQARQQNDYQNALSWLQGYISAYNEYEYAGKDPDGVLGTKDADAVAQWMDNYCKQNESSNPQEAIANLIEKRQHLKNACPVRKQSGRPCIPEEEPEKPAINEEQ
jgi:hypothetical protein